VATAKDAEFKTDQSTKSKATNMVDRLERPTQRSAMAMLTQALPISSLINQVLSSDLMVKPRPSHRNQQFTVRNTGSAHFPNPKITKNIDQLGS
jgi:hypothetical protein